MPDQPVWNYRSIIDAADVDTQEQVRDELYRTPFKVRLFHGEITTTSVYETASELDLYNPDHAIDVYQAFHDAGGYEWNPVEQIIDEVEDPTNYAHRLRRPAHIPLTPGAPE